MSVAHSTTPAWGRGGRQARSMLIARHQLAVPAPHLRSSSSYKGNSWYLRLKSLAHNCNYYINADDCKTVLGFLSENTRLPTLPEEIKLLLC